MRVSLKGGGGCELSGFVEMDAVRGPTQVHGVSWFPGRRRRPDSQPVMLPQQVSGF